MKMTHSAFSTRSFLPVLLALVAALVFPAAHAAHAQEGSDAPEYVQKYTNAMKTAKQGVQMQKSDDFDGAVEQYEASYRELADVVGMAKEAGSVENANKAQKMAAQLAFRAGSLLQNEGRSEEAITHFEFGQEIAPPSYTRNSEGLQVARNSLKQGPVVEASQALRNGNASRTIELLSGLDEQTGTSYFYQALAYQQLNDAQNAASYARRAIDAGGLDSSKRGQLYLVIGESHLSGGDDDSARGALEQAASLGSPQVQSRAEALLEQL